MKKISTVSRICERCESRYERGTESVPRFENSKFCINCRNFICHDCGKEVKRKNNRDVCGQCFVKTPEGRVRQKIAQDKYYHSEKGIKKIKEYRQKEEVKEGQRLATQKWRENHKDEIIIKNIENKEQINDRRRKNYWKNHERSVLSKNKSNRKYRSNKSNFIKILVKNAFRRAQDKNIEYELKLLLLAENPPEICACCGCELDYTVGKGKNPRYGKSPSLDRVDNESGYTVKNVEVICVRCNTVKNSASLKEIENLINYMENFIGNRDQ